MQIIKALCIQNRIQRANCRVTTFIHCLRKGTTASLWFLTGTTRKQLPYFTIPAPKPPSAFRIPETAFQPGTVLSVGAKNILLFFTAFLFLYILYSKHPVLSRDFYYDSKFFNIFSHSPLTFSRLYDKIGPREGGLRGIFRRTPTPFQIIFLYSSFHWFTISVALESRFSGSCSNTWRISVTAFSCFAASRFSRSSSSQIFLFSSVIFS